MSEIVICKNYPLGNDFTIFLLKPDSLKRKIDGEIVRMIRESEFSILAKKKRRLDSDEVKIIFKKTFERDYKLGANDPRTRKAIKYMTSGDCLCLLVRNKKYIGDALFAFSKKVKGKSWIPDKCDKESIRFRLRDKKYDNYSPKFDDGYLQGEFPENLLHTVDSIDELSSIFEIFFNDLVEKYDYIPPTISREKEKKIDILFCLTYSNSSSEKMRIKMHSGITHLCSYLRNCGFSAEIRGFDDESINIIEETINHLLPKYIGFSPVASEFGFVRQISYALRETNPEIIQIGGGPHFTIFPQDLKSTNIDAICVGEGEFPLKSVLLGNPFEKVNGWIYRRGDYLVSSTANRSFINDINKLPIADHHLWDRYLDQKTYPHRRILASRGCPYNCSYCCNYSISKKSLGNYVRFRSSESIEKEINLILEGFPQVECIFFESEIFHPSLGLDEGVFQITRKYKDKLRFGTNLRIGVFDNQYLRKLQKNGFTYAYVGIESGNEELRRKILHRNYTNEEAIKIFHDARAIGFKLNSYNLIGLPEESLEKFEDTITLNKQCNPNEAQLSIFFPYPGTELYYFCLDHGYLKNPFFHYNFSDYERRKTVLNMPKFDENEIMKGYKKFRAIFG